MSKIWSDTDKAKMRAAYIDSMVDVCVIQKYSRTINSFGEPVASYTDQAQTVCGLEQQSGGEQHRDDLTVVTWDATLRLPYNFSIEPKDRVKITKRFNETITPMVYEVVAPMELGVTGVQVRLQIVQV